MESCSEILTAPSDIPYFFLKFVSLFPCRLPVKKVYLVSMDVSMVFAVLLLFFAGIAVFSFLLNGLLLKFSKTLGIRNNTETVIRWSATSKPALGGISFFICFLISVAGYAVFFSENTPLYHDKKLLGLLASSGIAFLMGLSDDAYNTKPLFKLLTQIICGIILIFSGIYISVFENNVFNYLLTVVWVVGMMNSINMLDNMDAITAIVSSFIILTAIVVYFMNDQFLVLYLLMLAGVLASIAGFLFYNWHPSKIFMGDTGSQFLGVFLAATGIMFFWNSNADVPGVSVEIKSRQLAIVILAFIIPIIDTTTVTVNRILRGQSPFVGGRDHTTHSLSYLGFSDRQVALIFAGISLISFIFIFLITNFIDGWNYYYLFLIVLYFFVVFFVLFGCTRFEKVREKINVQ